MNASAIIQTSCKLFGLYFFVRTTLNLQSIIYLLAELLASSNEYEMNFLVLAGGLVDVVLNIAIGFFLIRKAAWIAEKLSPLPAGELNVNLDNKGWIELALIIISAMTLLFSAPEILNKLGSYLYFNEYEENERHFFWTQRNKADLFYSIFKFAVALVLLTNARNIATKLQKIGDKDDSLSA